MLLPHFTQFTNGITSAQMITSNSQVFLLTRESLLLALTKLVAACGRGGGSE